MVRGQKKNEVADQIEQQRAAKRQQGKYNFNKLLSGVQPGNTEVDPEVNTNTEMETKTEQGTEPPVQAPEPEPEQPKIKRSYMLTEDQNDRLYLLKGRLFRKMDLSEIIGFLIDEYYEDKFPEE